MGHPRERHLSEVVVKATDGSDDDLRFTNKAPTGISDPGNLRYDANLKVSTAMSNELYSGGLLIARH